MEWKQIRVVPPRNIGVWLSEKSEWILGNKTSTRSRGGCPDLHTGIGSPHYGYRVDQELVVLYSAEKYVNQWFIRGQWVHEKSQVRKSLKEDMSVTYTKGRSDCPKLIWKFLSHSSLLKIWMKIFVLNFQFYKSLGSSKLPKKIED